MKICTHNPVYDIDKWSVRYRKELKKEGLAQNSILLYERILGQFAAYVQTGTIASLKEIDSGFIRDFLEWMEDQRRDRTKGDDFYYSENTKRLYIIVLKTFFDFIEDNAELQADGTRYSFAYEFKELGRKKRGRRAGKQRAEIKYLSGDEIANLLDYLDLRIEERGKHYDYIYSLAVRLMLYGGLRVSEMLGLRVGDIQIHGSIVEFRLEDTKSGMIQYVPVRLSHIEKELRYVLENAKVHNAYIVANRSFTVPLKRTNLFAKVNKIYADAGVKKRGLHILRHTAAMLLLEKTRDATLVQKLLRHASINTTSIYIHRDVKQLGEKIV